MLSALSLTSSFYNPPSSGEEDYSLPTPLHIPIRILSLFRFTWRITYPTYRSFDSLPKMAALGSGAVLGIICHKNRLVQVVARGLLAIQRIQAMAPHILAIRQHAKQLRLPWNVSLPSSCARMERGRTYRLLSPILGREIALTFATKIALCTSWLRTEARAIRQITWEAFVLANLGADALEACLGKPEIVHMAILESGLNLLDLFEMCKKKDKQAAIDTLSVQKPLLQRLLVSQGFALPVDLAIALTVNVLANTKSLLEMATRVYETTSGVFSWLGRLWR